MFPQSNSMGLSGMSMHMLHEIQVCAVCIVGVVMAGIEKLVPFVSVMHSTCPTWAHQPLNVSFLLPIKIESAGKPARCSMWKLGQVSIHVCRK